MPLTGKAKAAYQREYMRQRRAAARQGQPSHAPRPGHEAELDARIRDLEKMVLLERGARLNAEAKGQGGA